MVNVENFGAEVMPDERKKFGEFPWLRHPIKSYFSWIKNSIIPERYSHQVKMNINIKAGDREGIALIPCTIYAMDHGIDLNPALILKKDAKMVGYFPPGKKEYIKDETLNTHPFFVQEGHIIRYNPVHIVIKVTDDERQAGYEMVEYEEFQRCEHCRQKLVISEVKQTRYRSCPSVKVKLGDPAKADTIVPVEFGVNKADITAAYWAYPLVMLLCIAITFSIFNVDAIGWVTQGFVNAISKFGGPTNITLSPGFVENMVIVSKIIILGIIWVYYVPRLVFKGYSLLKWYHKVKGSMVKQETNPGGQ